MKNLIQIISISLLGLIFSLPANGQSGPFFKRFFFNEIDGNPTPYTSYIRFGGPTDLAGKGAAIYFSGNPSKQEVHNRIFSNPNGAGQFFLTNRSSTPLKFYMDYGYIFDDDARLIFDRVTVSTGDIGAESFPQILTRHDITNNCNTFDQDCRVYQRHYFDFDRSQPYANAETHYTKLLIIRYYKGTLPDGSPKCVKTLILPITITGDFTKYIGTSPGPIELTSILRAVPGDASRSYLNITGETSREVSMSMSTTEEEGTTTSASANVGFSAGPISGGVEVSAESSKTYSETNGKENTYTVSFTATEAYENTSDSDLFIAEQRKMDYGLNYNVIALGGPTSNTIRIQAPTKMVFYPHENPIRTMSFTEKDLLTSEIPNLVANNKAVEAKYWQDIIAMNNRIKANAIFKREITNQGAVEYTKTTSSSESISQEVSINTSESLKLTASVGFELGPISGGGEASVEKTYSFTSTTSNGNTNAAQTSNTIGFEIMDDQFGDGFEKHVIDLHEDGVFGTPVFFLNESESRTSCPYEGGQARDQVSITVADPITNQQVKSAKYSGLDIGSQDAVFMLQLCNNNSSEDRDYRIKVEEPGGQGARVIKGGLNYSSEVLNIAKGTCRPINILVEQLAPKILAYPDIQMILESECDPEIGDTVHLAVFFGGSDTNPPPSNNMVCDAILLPADGTIVTQYQDKFGGTRNISNINAVVIPGEEVLTPPTDCATGWCSELPGVPEIEHSVWFKFVATTNEAAISTCDATNQFDSQMALYRTTDCTDLSTFTLIAANDDACGFNGFHSRIYRNDLIVGDTYYVLIDGYSGTTGDFGIQVTAPAPQNDGAESPDFLQVNGKPNEGTIGIGIPDFQYSNYQATVESYEGDTEQLLIPDSVDAVTGWRTDPIQHSVWFSFAPPPGGEIIIDITNANFDTQVSLYESSVSGPQWYFNYTNIGANDDVTKLGGFGSHLEAKVDPNLKYWILVDGYQGQMGTFDITLSIPPPLNDDPRNAITLETDGRVQGPFSNRGGTASSSEQFIVPPYNATGIDGWQAGETEGNFATRAIEQSIWFKFVAPLGGALEISTCNMTSAPTQLALYKAEDYRYFNTYEYIAANHHSEFCYEPPSNDSPNGRNIRGSIITIDNLQPDSTYYLLVDGNQFTYSTFDITLTQPPADPPANDEACNAIALPTNGVIQTGFTNLGATVAQDESDINPDTLFSDSTINNLWIDASINSSVWFTFVAPASGEAEISTCGLATFNTQLAVYSVTDCNDFGSFTLIGNNDDGPSNCATGGDSFLPIKGLTPGQTYHILVDGNGLDVGNFDISIKDAITPGPSNDEVMNAILLPVNGVAQTGYTNSLATVSNGEQAIRSVFTEGDNCIDGWCDNQVDNSVWFKFVAPADGKAIVSTCGLADFDTQLALYQAGNVNTFSTFTLIAANDAGPDSCSTFYDSYLPLEGLTPGVTYYIMVDGFDGANGMFAISISPALPETGDDCASDSAPLTVANTPNDIPADTYQARTIISDGTINAGSVVVFKSATTITLQPGFWAKAGSNFTAVIEDCPEQVMDLPTSKITPLVETISNEAATKALVARVYPNPATYQLTFEMVLPEAATVGLRLFDLMGRNVQTLLANNRFDKGFHQILIPIADLEAGVYFLQLASGNQMITERVVIQK